MERLWLGTWLRFWFGTRAAPYVPTPSHVGLKMLKLAQVTKDDVVFDLGCGDGRLLLQAAKLYGARCHGVELNEELLQHAEKTVAKANLTHLVKLTRQDIFKVDLSPATVVLLYLTPRANRQLLPLLQRQLRPGARLVSFCWRFETLEAKAVAKADGIPIFLYLM
jgi:tRNA A58 N-methylase Trm61